MQHQVWDILNGSDLQLQILDELKHTPRIGMIELFISDTCPLACKHCFHADVRSVDPPLSLQEWIVLIDQFIDMGGRHFHLAGREPFTEKVTLDVLAYLSVRKQDVDLKLGAISNGLNCRKHLQAIQASALDYLEISIDGLADTHDFMRGKGTYRRTIDNLAEIISVLGERHVSTATALTKRNLDQIPEIIQSLSHLGLRRFFFQPVMPMGYALSLHNLLLDGKEYGQAILRTRQKLAQAEFQNAGIVVMFYVPVEMLFAVCQGNAWIEQELLDSLYQETSVTKQGVNYLQLDFAIARVPFWRHVIVTEDGYFISDCASRAVPHYQELSAGSIRHMPLPEIIGQAQALAIRQVERILADKSILTD